MKQHPCNFSGRVAIKLGKYIYNIHHTGGIFLGVSPLILVRVPVNWLLLCSKQFFNLKHPLGGCGECAWCIEMYENKDWNVIRNTCVVVFFLNFFKLAVALLVTLPIAQCVFNRLSHKVWNLCVPAVPPYHNELGGEGERGKNSYHVSDNHWDGSDPGFCLWRVP